MGLKQTLDISLEPRDRCKKSITKKKVSELGHFTVIYIYNIYKMFKYLVDFWLFLDAMIFLKAWLCDYKGLRLWEIE